jgi:hypothetical protein
MSHDRPMVLAVLGDFGGRRQSGTRRLQRVDRDSLDAVLARLGVEVEVPAGAGEATLRLETVDDFHPDALVRRVPGLASPLDDREAPGAAEQSAGAPAPPAVHTSGSLLDAILGGPPHVSPAEQAVRDFARRVAEPWTAPEAPAAAETRSRAEALRAVLYAPRFRALEAAWRGLAALVREAETGPGLEIRVLDAAREDAPLLLAEELATPGAPRPACALAGYTFGPSDLDLAVLEQFGAVALAAGMPLVADASPSILGLRDARELGDAEVRRRIGLGAGPDAWRAFRALPSAVNVTLCLPRVLLRAPYGPSGEPVAAFPFDEEVTGRDHERFLWGSAAVAYGRVLVRAFAAEGWEADLGRYATLEGLPVHVWREGGEECVLPCAETVMSDATAARVVEEGLMVAASVRGADRVEFRRP